MPDARGENRAAAMAARLEEVLSRVGRPVTFMEVCGTHTVAIFRSGLRSLLPEGIRLLSGPGCPVCVTDQSEIDMALALAERDCVVLTYGDMLRVPGSRRDDSPPCSLMELKAGGARVEVVTSAMRPVEIARDNPGSEVVFLAVGFETTAPATAVALKRARSLDLKNFSVLCLHKRVPPVLRALCANPKLNVDGFILPGNVVLVAGVEDYEFLSELRKAAAAAGFEAEEILAAMLDLAGQIETNRFRLSAYRFRDVPRTGNRLALQTLSEVFETCDSRWRGLGLIPGSGYRIGGGYARFDARGKFALSPGLNSSGVKPDGCRCGEVLSGLLLPAECELYGSACTPATPVGPCMVSAEGTCGAWHRFGQRR